MGRCDDVVNRLVQLQKCSLLRMEDLKPLYDIDIYIHLDTDNDLSDEDSRRGKWPLARIIKIMPGDDGIVRVAQVRTKDGIYTQPVVKLHKLEDNIEVPQGDGDVNGTAL